MLHKKQKIWHHHFYNMNIFSETFNKNCHEHVLPEIADPCLPILLCVFTSNVNVAAHQL